MCERERERERESEDLEGGVELLGSQHALAAAVVGLEEREEVLVTRARSTLPRARPLQPRYVLLGHVLLKLIYPIKTDMLY